MRRQPFNSNLKAGTYVFRNWAVVGLNTYLQSKPLT